MGNHIDTRSQKRKKLKEHDDLARRRKASFKQYLRDIDEELNEAEDYSSEADDENLDE